MKVKILGAGSIGNHLTQASRRMGWDVTVVDKDPEALRRMKEEIYPARYGAWDDAIQQFSSSEEPKGGFDVVCVGTPPDVRLKVAMAALDEKPKILQLEKPLCQPTLEGLDEFLKKYEGVKNEVVVIVGYDHTVAESIEWLVSQLPKIGEAETVDVEFREHWGGIFAAHPWLAGPQDSYLGYWKRGGGAGGEHSHALHLWQYLAGKSGIGRWREANIAMEFRRENGTEYDAVSAFSFRTDKEKIGRVIQDVITKPTRKWARIQGKDGFLDWFCGGSPEGDVVRYAFGAETGEKVFLKKRPDDFYRETLHMQSILDGKVSGKDSPLSLESALSVLQALHSAYEKGGIGTFAAS